MKKRIKKKKGLSGPSKGEIRRALREELEWEARALEQLSLQNKGNYYTIDRISQRK